MASFWHGRVDGRCCFADHLGESIGKAAEVAARSTFRHRATKHLQDMLCGTECFNEPRQIGVCGVGLRGLGYEVSGLRSGLVIFALQVRQGDSEIAHGHIRGAMTEEFHDAGKAYARTEHRCGVGVSKLMRDDPHGDSRRGSDFVQ